VNEAYVLRPDQGKADPLSFSASSGGGVTLGETAAPLRILRRERSGLVVLLWGDRIVSGLVKREVEGEILELEIDGRRLRVRARPAAVDAMEQRLHGPGAVNGAIKIASPIPGLVKEVRVAVGQVVKAEETLVILEAMKMENQIVAPHDGTIESVSVSAGQTVPAGAPLVVLKT